MAALIIVEPAANDKTLVDTVPNCILPEIMPVLRMPPTIVLLTTLMALVAPVSIPELITFPVIVDPLIRLNPVAPPVTVPLLSIEASIVPLLRSIPPAIVPLLLTFALIALEITAIPTEDPLINPLLSMPPSTTLLPTKATP